MTDFGHNLQLRMECRRTGLQESRLHPYHPSLSVALYLSYQIGDASYLQSRRQSAEVDIDRLQRYGDDAVVGMADFQEDNHLAQDMAHRVSGHLD